MNIRLDRIEDALFLKLGECTPNKLINIRLMERECTRRSSLINAFEKLLNLPWK